MNRIRWTIVFLIIGGCSPSLQNPATLTLATTTSTRDSGILNVLLPRFKKETGIEVKVIAVGSGQALELGRRGDADVLLTHSPEAEKKFMDRKHGSERHPVMHNDFILIGPVDDPASIANLTEITEAFSRIAKNESPFISRGDESGTHSKEKSIWKKCELVPQGHWYSQAGAGMAEVLRIAGEKQAYALCDRSTFLSQQKHLDLQILFDDDRLMHNPYSVIVVSSEKHSQAKHRAANRFAEFLLLPETQEEINKFGIEKFGQQLFFSHKLSESNE